MNVAAVQRSARKSSQLVIVNRPAWFSLCVLPGGEPCQLGNVLISHNIMTPFKILCTKRALISQDVQKHICRCPGVSGTETLATDLFSLVVCGLMP